MSDKTIVRPATQYDLDLLMDLGTAMHAESPRYGRYKYSENRVLQMFVSMIASPDCLLLVAEKGEEIIGAMLAMITPQWFSDELVANELTVFVAPQHRGGMAAVRLIRAYIEWAKSKGAKDIQLGVSTGVKVEETAALYRKLGLKQFSIGFEV